MSDPLADRNARRAFQLPNGSEFFKLSHSHFPSPNAIFPLFQAALLSAARNALAEVRSREPSDSRHRRTGPTITAIASAGDRGTLLGGRKPAPTTLAFAWESDDDEDNTDEVESFTSPRGSADNGLPPPPITGGGGAGFSGGMGSGPPGSLDSWFGDKVDTGGMQLRAAAMKPAGVGVAVLDRPDLPTSLEFAPPEAPVESGAATIFPESISLRFHSETSLDEYEEEASAVDVNVPSAEKYERTSGEEYGPDGYWYRWTEIRGQDATGAVQWSERWWDVSDWRGMKEKGAEKWGTNDRGDAWRETWREAISIDDAAGQPKVERSAHKWARAAGQQEWEEKWSESYWSGGKTEKWADKWGRDAGDVWHERWGESYDGKGEGTREVNMEAGGNVGQRGSYQTLGIHLSDFS